jgi:hypothetical protein
VPVPGRAKLHDDEEVGTPSLDESVEFEVSGAAVNVKLYFPPDDGAGSEIRKATFCTLLAGIHELALAHVAAPLLHVTEAELEPTKTAKATTFSTVCTPL